jgi:VanZ family protein
LTDDRRRVDRLFNARTLFVLSALFIVYGTTIPWDFAGTPSLDRIAPIPFWDAARGRIPSIPDIVQNVVLFVPFGFFGALAWGGGRGAAVAWVVLAGAALSLGVEVAQTASVSRTPSATDLATNTIGTVLGAVAAALYARHLRVRVMERLTWAATHRPGLIVVAALAAATGVDALWPFLPTLDVGTLKENVKALLANPWGDKPAGTLVGEGLVFAAIAAVATHELAGLGRARAAGAAAALTTAFAVACELAQVTIEGHAPSGGDVMAALGGASVGAAMAAGTTIEPARALGEITRRMPWRALAFAGLVPVLRALAPFELASDAEIAARLRVTALVPFHALFANVTGGTFANVFEAAAAYAPLGWVLTALGTRGRAAVVAPALLAEVLELAQIGIRGRTVDVTEGLYAAFGAAAATWAYAALRARTGGTDGLRPTRAGPTRPPPARP